MVKCAWVLSAALLAVGVCFLAGAEARNAAPGAVNADVQKVADAVNKPDQFKKLANQLATKCGLVLLRTAKRPGEGIPIQPFRSYDDPMPNRPADPGPSAPT
jgi:hypothetical protein